MGHRSLIDPLASSDSPWDDFSQSIWAFRFPSEIPQERPPSTPVVLPDETAEAKGALQLSTIGGAGSQVALTSGGGLTINLNFDGAAMTAPASFRAGIQQAAAI